jgi:hypothetical protein
VSTTLPLPAAAAWDTVKRPETLRYVTKGLLGFRSEGELPAQFAAGETYRVRLLFFGFVPAWCHEIHLVRVDDVHREILTDEHGGAVKEWHHRITIDERGPWRSHYTDEIEIAAGPLTPLVWLYAQLIFRYRRRRWRRLARRIGPQPAGSA